MTVKEYLDITEADDYYWVNIREENSRKRLYFGYNDRFIGLTNLENRNIISVYVDWASECLGIVVKKEEGGKAGQNSISRL